MKKASLLFVVAFTFTLSASAQGWRGSLRLQGAVTDSKTGQPVPDATVKLRITTGGGGGPDVKTDSKGKWAVLGLLNGNWNIDVDAAGYQSRKLSVSLGADRVPPMKIELDPVVKEEAPPEQAAAPVPDEVRIGGVAVSSDIADAIEQGNALLKDNKFKEAINQYEKAYPTLSSNLSLKVALARAYYGAGDRKKAIVLLDEAYKADPTNAQNALLLANLVLEDGQLDRGKAIIEALPAGTLTDPTALVNIGILLLNKKQPGLAYDYFSKAIAIDATHAETFYYRGLAAVQTNKMKDAKADLQKVIALAPDSNEAKDARELLKSIK